MTDLSKPIIVAVDGPAGSGKSSICTKVCDIVGWSYLNTGALYRGVGLVASRMGIDLDNEGAVAQMVEKISAKLSWDSGSKSLSYCGEDLSRELLTQEAGAAASKIAKQPLVREKLLPVQRELILESKGALVDGRDIGTVVFPNANLKIFLTASLAERTRRRLNQLVKAGTAEDSPETFDRIQGEIATRDTQDEQRGEAPLRKANDAIELDTSDMGLDEVVNKIVAMLKERGLVH